MGQRGEGEEGGGTERKRWEQDKEEENQEGNGNCHRHSGPRIGPDSQEWGSTSFAPVLVGFLPDTSGFQQSYCSRGSLGSHGN